jgi:dihydroneopterin aldolase
MDQIFVRDLVVEGVIGWYRWEQRIRRPLRFDVTLDVDTGLAARSGNIEDTVNYESVANLIRSITEDKVHALLEVLVEEIATAILARFPCQRVRLCVAKPGAVPGAREVGLVIERGRA